MHGRGDAWNLEGIRSDSKLNGSVCNDRRASSINRGRGAARHKAAEESEDPRRKKGSHTAPYTCTRFFVDSDFKASPGAYYAGNPRHDNGLSVREQFDEPGDRNANTNLKCTHMLPLVLIRKGTSLSKSCGLLFINRDYAATSDTLGSFPKGFNIRFVCTSESLALIGIVWIGRKRL